MKIILIILAVLILIDIFWNPTDPTDKSYWKRSGLKYYKDHGTGKEYIAACGLFSCGPLKERERNDF